MSPDDRKLLAYVDGELSVADVASVEAALAASAELREAADRLRASQLPYREAFAMQTLPPLPDELQRQIEMMAHAAQRADAGRENRRSARPLARWLQAPQWLVAAFVSGGLCTALVLMLVGPTPLALPGSGGFTGASGEATPWVRAVVNYQRLYTRDTVSDITPDLAASARTVEAIHRVDGLALRVPDLQSAGLSFKVVRRLHFDNRPLVQIVYLPEHGAPVALCVMHESQPDNTIRKQVLDGMAVVSWRENELSYALIGEPGSADFQSIARQISANRVDAIFATAQVVAALLG